ncbi:MAG: PIN domain-containing protein [Chloroflexia bacterium]
MTVGVVDTTVIIHLFRGKSVAHAWLAMQPERLALTSITWPEVMYGAPGRAGQADCRAILEQFELLHLTVVDQDWAMRMLETYRLSHGIGVMDCLIASVCHRLQVPLYTHNLRD